MTLSADEMQHIVVQVGLGTNPDASPFELSAEAREFWEATERDFERARAEGWGLDVDMEVPDIDDGPTVAAALGDAANPYHDPKDGRFTHGPGGHTKSGLKLTHMGRAGERLLIARQNSLRIRERFGEMRETPKTAQGQNPIDVESDTHAIEVKTMDSRSARLRITMKATEVSRKENAAVDMGKEPAVIGQVFDAEAGRMHVFAYEGGFRQQGHEKGNFEVETVMEPLGSYEVSIAEFERAAREPVTAAAAGDVDEAGMVAEPGDTVIEFEEIDGEWAAFLRTVPDPPVTAAADRQPVPTAEGVEVRPVELPPSAIPTRQALRDAIVQLEAEAAAVVFAALEPVLANVTDTVTADMPGTVTAAAIDGLTSILDEWGVAVDAEVLPYYERVYRLGGYSAMAQMAEAGASPGFVDFEMLPFEAEYLQEPAARHLATVKDRFAKVGDKAWTEARTVMLAGVDQGLPVDEIARNLRGVVDLTRAEAMQVARSQVTSAANAGALKQAALLGEDAPLFKQWIATGDERTRPSHVAADGLVVEREAYFLVGGSALAHPGDPFGPDEEILNCRCSLLFTDDPQGFDMDMPGRAQGGGVLEDVASGDPFGRQQVEIPDELRGLHDAIEAFDALDHPGVSLNPAGGPSQALIDYEMARQRLGHMLDASIRSRIGDIPPIPSMMVKGLPDEVFGELDKLQSLLMKNRRDTLDYMVRYNAELRRQLGQLGIRWGSRTANPHLRLTEVWPETIARGTYDLFNDAVSRLPSKWVERIAMQPLSEVRVTPYTQQGQYAPALRMIGLNPAHVDRGDVQTMIHEMNHHLAFIHPDIHQSEWVEKWLREKDRGQWPTPTLTDLASGRNVWTRPDEYPISYMGRDYGTGAPTPDPEGGARLAELWTSTIQSILGPDELADLGAHSDSLQWGHKVFRDRQLLGWALSVLLTL